mmetsp:Transcript_54645/g.130403  ORF Transcript_54645/g.130403 Transcript_54645/m.130403 type:complete len:81 (-) Transcript_54645:177-419(-)
MTHKFTPSPAECFGEDLDVIVPSKARKSRTVWVQAWLEHTLHPMATSPNGNASATTAAPAVGEQRVTILNEQGCGNLVCF